MDRPSLGDTNQDSIDVAGVMSDQLNPGDTSWSCFEVVGVIAQLGAQWQQAMETERKTYTRLVAGREVDYKKVAAAAFALVEE